MMGEDRQSHSYRCDNAYCRARASVFCSAVGRVNGRKIYSARAITCQKLFAVDWKSWTCAKGWGWGQHKNAIWETWKSHSLRAPYIVHV
jgi:hypothetical protein